MIGKDTRLFDSVWMPRIAMYSPLMKFFSQAVRSLRGVDDLRLGATRASESEEHRLVTLPTTMRHPNEINSEDPASETPRTVVYRLTIPRQNTVRTIGVVEWSG